MAQGSNSSILLCNLIEDGLVIEARKTWSDVILLSHLKVFTEVLVSAPPVCVDHTKTFASSHLMEVGVANIILDAVSWESPVTIS